MAPREEPADRLGLARNLVLLTWIGAAAVLSLVLLHSTLRPHCSLNPARAAIRALELSNLSVVPTGRIWRNPEAISPCTDLRFSHALTGVEPDPADLVLRRPEDSDE
jgi:hypothetical protein